jgi:radical SAM protein with 4Fe4S-binding SPASM domain
MVMTPCSFDQDCCYGVSLRQHTIEEAWNSPAFEGFRDILRGSCPECAKRADCMGGCPLLPEIVLCKEFNTCQ